MNTFSYNPLKKAGAALAFSTLAIVPALAEDADISEVSLLDKYLISGGPLTWVIVAVGMLSVLGLIVFNAINLSKNKFNPDDLKVALFDHMVNCRVRSAIELSASHPSYLGRMLAYSLPNVDATKPESLGREVVEDAMADFSVNEGRKQMLWVNMIALIAQAAPMMGLFGTIVGMVETFATLAAANKADAARLLKN